MSRKDAKARKENKPGKQRDLLLGIFLRFFFAFERWNIMLPKAMNVIKEIVNINGEFELFFTCPNFFFFFCLILFYFSLFINFFKLKDLVE